jgi:hypothetical protein
MSESKPLSVVLVGADSPDRRRLFRVLEHLLNSPDEWDGPMPEVDLLSRLTLASPWSLGEGVEYQNGFRADVVHVDGEYAILACAPSYILAFGQPDAFCFPHEDAPEVPTLEAALAQLAAEKAKPS